MNKWGVMGLAYCPIRLPWFNTWEVNGPLLCARLASDPSLVISNWFDPNAPSSIVALRFSGGGFWFPSAAPGPRTGRFPYGLTVLDNPG